MSLCEKVIKINTQPGGPGWLGSILTGRQVLEKARRWSLERRGEASLYSPLPLVILRGQWRQMLSLDVWWLINHGWGTLRVRGVTCPGSRVKTSKKMSSLLALLTSCVSSGNFLDCTLYPPNSTGFGEDQRTRWMGTETVHSQMCLSGLYI